MSKQVVIWGAAFALVVSVVGLLSFGCGREEEAAAPEAMPEAAIEEVVVEAEAVVEEAAALVEEAAAAEAEALVEEAAAAE